MSKPLTKDPIPATITKLSHDGRGITQINGKTTFIDNALPGEQVLFTYTKRHNKYDEGKAIEIIAASPERVTPRCEHFSICGGCALQHMSNQAQWQMKQTMLLEQLQHFGGTQPEIILSPLTANSWGYRRKARLGVRYVIKKEALLVGFREKNGRYLADLKRCEVLDPRVGYLIETLKQVVRQLSIYQDIPQIEVAISVQETALIFRHMKPLSEADQTQLINFAKTNKIHLFLQPGKPDSAHLIWPEQTNQLLSYRLPEQHIELFFHPTDFTQINAELNQQMVTRALELLAPSSSDRILDLFCGLGNFTLPLARLCREIIGVEGDEAMVKRAQANATHNQITNARFYHADLNVPLNQAQWAQQTFDKILLDPPRTGALEIIKQLAQFKAKMVLYISCNPATLARDTAELIQQGYRLVKAGIMDMFPHTQHIEAIALFEK